MANSIGKYSGFGEKIGTFKVEDPFFSKSNLGLSCRGSKKFYRNNYDVYHNNNFFFAWDIWGRGFRILIGYRPIDNNKVFRIEGLEVGKTTQGKEYINSLFSVVKTDKQYYESLKNGVNIYRKSAKSSWSQTCKLDAVFINEYEKLTNPNYKPPVKKASSIL